MRKIWVYDPHSGGTPIPPRVRDTTERRLLDYAKKHLAGKFARIGVRFRGAFCYIDGYEEYEDTKIVGSPPAGETRQDWLYRLRNTPLHLCRIRYFGNEDRWSFAFYTYSQEKYEPSFLLSGEFQGTPEEALETSTQFY
ncbi:MAG: hypothetical protein ACKV2U_30210 [Bryobacteraceae bacterium]